ncbi:ADP-ribosyltransferase [Streptococcus halichoeri]|uniref:ADP-ribosyltransferase n=1 Tax=Streptococcus halichoeri TaxID=254785 RepID=UPI00135875E9|nr:ADP-ribosyltransferase [Streptococcus halichoeri]
MKTKNLFITAALYVSIALLAPIANNFLKSSDIVYAEQTKIFSTVDEATKWGEKLIKKASYSVKEKSEIYNYTKNSSSINTALRNSKGILDQLSTDLQTRIRVLDQAIFKVSTPEPVTVYRLLNYDFLQSISGLTQGDLENLKTSNKKLDTSLVNKLQRLMKQKIYREDGYSSTQLFNGSAVVGRPLELRLDLPKGTKLAYINSRELTAYYGQQEVLLPRGTEYSVQDVKTSTDHTRIIIHANVFKK